MASANDVMNEEVIHEDVLYKLAGKNKHLWNKSSPWKQKYCVLKRIGDKPVLEYYNKKPKNKNVQPKGRIHLFPTYRVEKVTNTRNRAYVFEITTPQSYLCLSADEQKAMDVFVFYLQIQTQLKNQIQDDCVIVKPENSEAHRRIGARGTNCIMHLSPWGVTLALTSSRSVLSQWPLKSIRSYESTGEGHFMLEAGRVAPMGDGLYVFSTEPGQDNSMYDIMDQYVLDAMGKVQPGRRGTPEEMEDYVQELECLFGLATVNVCTARQPEIPQVLHDNWNHTVLPAVKAKPIVHLKKSQSNSSAHSSQDGSDTPPPLPNRITDSTRRGQDASIAGWVVVNKTFQNGTHQVTSTLADRPQLPLPSENERLTNPISIPSTKKMHQQNKFVKSVSQNSSDSQFSPFSPLVQDWASPPSFQEATARNSDSSFSTSPNLSPDPYLHPSLKKRPKGRERTDYFADSYLSPMTREDTPVPEEKLLTVKPGPRRLSRLRSVSCEDLSDYVKDLIYMPMNDNKPSQNQDKLEDDEPDGAKPPLPFPQLRSFVGSVDIDQRERSHSIDFYYNINSPRGIVDSSPSPTVAEIRRRYNTRVSSNLRKSLSNPNFIHALNKEIYRSNAMKSTGYVSPQLKTKSKSKSRSLVNLLPENLKRRLSKDSSKRDSGEAKSEDRRSTGSRHGSLPNSPPTLLTRQVSSQSAISVKVKGISLTEASRSFKKQVSEGSEPKGYSHIKQHSNPENIEIHHKPKNQSSPLFKKRGSPSPKLRRQNAEISAMQTPQKPKVPHKPQKKPCKSGTEASSSKLVNGKMETNC